MVTKKQWKRAIFLVLVAFSTLSLIALAEVFVSLFKLYVLEYSLSLFIGSLVIFSLYDLFLLYFFFLLFKFSPGQERALRMAEGFVCAGLVLSLILKCLYMFNYLYRWQFLPSLFPDISFALADITTYTPLMLFFYFFYRHSKSIKESRIKTPCFLSMVGALVIVSVNCLTLFSLLFPGIFSWFFAVEFSIFITLPRALSFFSFLYFFSTLRKYGREALTRM